MNTVYFGDYNNSFFNNKGWECPKCGSVYAPFVVSCYNCSGMASVTTNTQNVTNIPKEETPKPNGTVENPATYPSDTPLSKILPTRLANALHNKLVFNDKWICVKTISDLTNVINEYGFTLIEDCKNVGSKSVSILANLYGLSVWELRNKNPEIGYWKRKDMKRIVVS